jgi:hypothetical protein
MKKYLRRKYTISAFSILIFALCFSVSVAAQILKPGEIIYSRAATVPGGNCDTAAIWAVGQDGSNDRFITQGLHPRISPDGRLILFKRFQSNAACGPFTNAPPEWWTRDLATRQETHISNNFLVSYGHGFSPETNRGESQIIFDDLQGICRMNLDGTNRVCNFFAPRQFGHLSVRGSDSLVAMGFYDTNFPAVAGLSVFTYDFQNLTKIPNTANGDLNPSWSNDGQFIAYAFYTTLCCRTEPYFFTNLFRINPDGSNKTQLTFFTQPPGDGFSYSLIWTKDNSTILNAARINGIAGIYKISANGGGILGTIPITPGAPPEWVGGIAPPYSEQQTASFGGGVSANGNYTLVDTVGQAFAGQTSAGANFNLQSGFWANPPSAHSPFDFDGDGRTDISIFRPSAGEWWYSKSSNSETRVLQFGTGTDKIAPADFTGDGKTDIAIWRPSNGSWFILRSEDFSFYSVPFGTNGDVPVPADYDGDGKTDVAVFRPSTNTWFISLSSGGTSIGNFGASGDVPVPADYDGDGKADIAIYRPAVGEWWIQRSNLGLLAFQFGASADKPVQGDYTGDGKTDAAFWRPSTGVWFILRSEDFSFFSLPFGALGDIPAPGDYDGDGKFDTAVFRPNGSTWFINQTTAGTQITQFGASGDRPVPNSFVP